MSYSSRNPQPARRSLASSGGTALDRVKDKATSPVQRASAGRAGSASSNGGAATASRASYRVSKGGKNQSNTGTIILFILGALVIVFLLSLFLHMGKIHNHIYIGDVDVSGMKRSEAIAAVDAYYTPLMNEGTVIAYASPDVKSQKQADNMYQMITINETYLENHPDIISRIISCSELDGAVASADLVQEAYDYGRGFSGLAQRLALLFNDHIIEPRANYGQVALQSIADSFDSAIGIATANSAVVVEDGYAKVIPGNDGYTVGVEQLTGALDKAFFSKTDNGRYFVLFSTYTPSSLSEETAQAAADKYNNAVGDGLVFSYNGNFWSVTPLTLASWITVVPVQASDGTWYFDYNLNESAIHSFLLKHILKDEKDSIPVTMTENKGKVTVTTGITGTIPALSEAVSSLKASMFGSSTVKQDAGAVAIDNNPVYVSVDTMTISGSLSIEDAIEKGVVSPISSYSTCYINGSTTDNRTYNVLLAASMINGTIVKSGEEFSFNSIVGATTEDKGFKMGTVIDATGEMVDGVGGGVCQVATTLFNAVYEAGFTVNERYAHTLYNGNYPDGRDAMVDFPSTDLRWVNDTDSDLYVSFTDDGRNITCTLYGADPHYIVYSYTWPMQELYGYSTVYRIDPSKPSDYSQVASVGVSARHFTVWRKVIYPDGVTVKEDRTFESNYRAINEVVIIGPGEFADEMKAAGLVKGYVSTGSE